jgi:hypothetical protein
MFLTILLITCRYIYILVYINVLADTYKNLKEYVRLEKMICLNCTAYGGKTISPISCDIKDCPAKVEFYKNLEVAKKRLNQPVPECRSFDRAEKTIQALKTAHWQPLCGR